MAKVFNSSAPFSVTFQGSQLFIHRRSQHVSAENWNVIYDGDIHQHWRDRAAEMGFTIKARVRDRYHVALQCAECGELTAHKIYALRTSIVRCEYCAHQKRLALSKAAGLEFLGRDPKNRHYALYKKSDCGHVLRRNTVSVGRIAARIFDAQCEECQRQREASEADEFGWKWIERDPGNPSYRFYEHECGNQQRIAVANMRNGECDCAQCGQSWTSKKSHLYIFRISFPKIKKTVLKFGYSSRPNKRLRLQLGLDDDAKSKILRTAPITNGHTAQRFEKTEHVRLANGFPEMVIHKKEYGDLLNVCSEIYDPALLNELNAIFDRVEQSPGNSETGFDPLSENCEEQE